MPSETLLDVDGSSGALEDVDEAGSVEEIGSLGT